MLEYEILIKTFLSLGIVLAGIYAFGYFFKTKLNLQSSFKIIDRCSLDTKRQMLILEHKQKQYILLLSPYGDKVIDTIILQELPEPKI